MSCDPLWITTAGFLLSYLVETQRSLPFGRDKQLPSVDRQCRRSYPSTIVDQIDSVGPKGKQQPKPLKNNGKS